MHLFNNNRFSIILYMFNFRLYSKSDEVKERKLIEKRKQEYADNREKAKAYHQVSNLRDLKTVC